MRLGGDSSLISSSVRPVSAEPSCSSTFQAGSSSASLCLISSHSLPFSELRQFHQYKAAAKFFSIQAELDFAAVAIVGLRQRCPRERTFRGPRPSRCPRRSCLREFFLRSRRIQADDLPSARPAACPRNSGTAPWARPRISACRRWPVESRSADDVAACFCTTNISAPESSLALRRDGSGVRSNFRFRSILFQNRQLGIRQPGHAGILSQVGTGSCVACRLAFSEILAANSPCIR